MTTAGSGGFGELVGLRPLDSQAEGEGVVELMAGPGHLNLAGTVHGGVLATLCDTAMGQAVRSATDGTRPATSQLTVTYLAPGREGRLVAIARVRKVGSAITLVEADVEQDGTTLVHAVATFALLKH